MLTQVFLALGVLAAGPVTWSFEDVAAGRLPHGWSAHKTGTGPGSVWKVVEDPQAHSGRHVLAQTSSEGPRPLFSICVCEEARFKDLELSLAVKAIQGKIDRGGGPVWRFQDANNYYVCRWNPLEENFRVYKVVGGKRTQMGSVEAKVAAGTWHAIRVEHRGNRIRCSLDGKLQLDVTDDTLAQPGKVGLWCKADAVTFFDDLQVQAMDER